MTISAIPQSSFFTRYVLENPWPLGIALLIACAICVYIAMQRDDRRIFTGALGAAILAIAILVLGLTYETTAESAARATKTFVQAAVDGRTDDMIATLDPSATLHLGGPESPGISLDELERDIRTLDRTNRIESNRMSALRFGSNEADTAVTKFTCVTITESSYGPVQSKWMIQWRRDSKGIWRIRRLTAIEIAGKTPRGSALR